ARRRVFSVALTRISLWQGSEALPVATIAAADDVELRAGARGLGGGFTVAKKFGEGALRLTDDSVGVAWAKDAHAGRAALRGLLAPWEAGAVATHATRPEPRLDQPWRYAVAGAEIVVAVVAVVFAIMLWHDGVTTMVTPLGSGQPPLVST